MAGTPVDDLHREFVGLLSALDDTDQISLRSTADANFRKMLLLAAASYFERRLTEEVVLFVQDVTAKDHVVTWLIRKRVVERRYHSWFDWNRPNANQFFSMFGDSFRDDMKRAVDKDDGLSASIAAFMEIGRERNRLVHQDFANFTLEKTSAEIYEAYRLATKFVEWFPRELRRYSLQEEPDGARGAGP